jgi:hypothetical protein
VRELLYRISTGDLFLDGGLLGKGYSGHPPYVNDVSAQARKNEGPIPEGRWRIVGVPYDSERLGPFVLALEPAAGTETHGRSQFRIHGDNGKGTASHGCICISRACREMVWSAGCSELLVKA